ncbi:MAG: CRISPR system precrRNA processing endoribonuclease RAMP protein Cas6 [Thermoanaerobaculum sp.]
MDAWEAFLQLPVHTLEVRLASGGGTLPESRWWGSTVRGALGGALRFLLCSCRSESHRRDCPFARFFIPEGDGQNGPRYLPPPWSLSVKAHENELEVQLRIFSDAVEIIEALGLALEAAGFRGLGGRRFRVVGFKSSVASLASLVASWRYPKPVLLLESPVRLQEGGQPIRQVPSFSHLFAAACRRVRLCAWAWAGVNLPHPPPEHKLWATQVPVSGGQVHWEEKPRYSRRQKKLMRLGGLVGWVAYGGEWSWAWPWLRALPLLGLGKLTTMGLGEVRWLPAPPSS